MKSFLCLILLLLPLLAAPPSSGYKLGPDDVITVRVLDLEEFDPLKLTPVRIDLRGSIRLPLVGRIHAAGLTVEQLESELVRDLSHLMKDPEVSVAVTEFRSHPVSVLGAVKSPGVHQITGRKTLFEVLSLAGGLNPDAGNVIKITRPASSGPLPLASAVSDSAGAYSIGKLNIRDVMDAKNPGENIDILPNDVITVPKADLVYVIGAVHRSGGFVLSEKEQISVLQALSLAEGLDRLAASKTAKILRQPTPGAERVEIVINIERVLEGRAEDIELRANDILFIPNSAAKSITMRVLEAAIQTGTGVVIWRR